MVRYKIFSGFSANLINPHPVAGLQSLSFFIGLKKNYLILQREL